MNRTSFLDEYKLECYRKIKPLGTRENIWLVEDTVKGGCFVMHKLPSASRKIYETLKGMHHSGIVEVFDVFCHDDFLYVVEEYIVGSPLSDVIANEVLPTKKVIKIGKQLLNALSFLHKHNIVHRDIKPENIIYDHDANVKLIDFDIARFFVLDKSCDTTAKGSREYAPPEQFGFTQSDYRTDIYALGVTLNELATGKFPEEKMCGGRLGRVVRRCTELDPKRRYQTAEQTLRHIKWLETKRILLVLVSAITCSVAVLFIFPSVTRYEPQHAKTETTKNIPKESSASPDETSAISVEYEDRIIRIRPSRWYPSVLLAGNMQQDFTETLAGGSMKVQISLEKTEEQLTFFCTFSDGRAKQFSFEDISRQQYDQLGYSINTDIKNTSPEYEVMVTDIDRNGQEEFLVALAWRKPVNTPNPANRYYLTEYCTVWAIYNTIQGEPTCSKPLYFEGCMPELKAGTTLVNSACNEWYAFDSKNGIWLLC